MDQATIDHLKNWVGRSEETDDVVTATRVAAMAATLDHDDPWPQPGTPLPPLWHWSLCAPVVRQSAIGTDGHPRRGAFLPPVPLPRRLWAGGRLSFTAPLVVGDAVRRRSRVVSVEHKNGRSGDLVFVVVRHELSGAAGLAITEEHDIVYRQPAIGDEPPAPAFVPPDGAPWERRIRPDEVLLFRYSALTFNGHRIHYDRSYATEVEDYPGLVVHGPLIATLMADLVQRNLPQGKLAGFEFRATKPLFDTAPFFVRGMPERGSNTVQLWACDARGALAMQASAALA